MRAALFLTAALALTACSKPAEKHYADDLVGSAAAKLSAPKPAPVAAEAETAAPASAPDQPAERKPIVATTPMLAYSYDYAISAPAKAVRALASHDEAACQAAGPTICQVIGSQVTEEGKDQVSANLTLRAEPGWLKGFRDRLADEAKGAGGRLVKAGATSEDLTRNIVDTTATLHAKTVLRDRLQALLASRPGKLSDLLEVEQELARVQGEIDSTQSELAVMRGRVATSEIKLDYESGGVLAPQGVWSPLSSALNGVVRLLALSLGAMVSLAAVAAPWVLAIGGLLWLFRKRLPRFGAKAAKPAAPKPADG